MRQSACFVIETMSLREKGPQLKLPINVPKGSMPLQCDIFSTNSCLLKYQNTYFNLPPLMKVLTDFHLINEIQILVPDHCLSFCFSVSVNPLLSNTRQKKCLKKYSLK